MGPFWRPYSLIVGNSLHQAVLAAMRHSHWVGYIRAGAEGGSCTLHLCFDVNGIAATNIDGALRKGLAPSQLLFGMLRSRMSY